MLSDILSAAGWKSSLLARTTISGRWGLRFPCERSGGFHLMTRGTAVLRYDRHCVPLGTGDIVFVARGIHHELASSAREPALDITEFRARIARQEAADAVSFVSIRHEVPDRPQHPFFAELPDVILLRAHELPAHHPLGSAVTLASLETDANIGSDLITQRLADIILYYVIRHYLETHTPTAPGWRLALRQPLVLGALEALHARPARPWTLESLARGLGVSRATLANRFREALGATPMEYLARLRLRRGRDLLDDPAMTLEQAARAVGYSSAFAFSKAHKRVYGHSPRHAHV